MLLRATRLAASRSFMKAGYASIAEPASTTGIRIVLHELRFDASSVHLYRKTKLNVSRITASFLTSPVSNSTPHPCRVYGDFDSLSMVGSLCQLRGGTMQSMTAMVEKQIGSIGCPSWVCTTGTSAVQPLPSFAALVYAAPLRALDGPAPTVFGSELLALQDDHISTPASMDAVSC